MMELLKELCLLSGMLSELALIEKNPIIKKVILELHIMVSDKIEMVSKYKELDTGDAILPPVSRQPATDGKPTARRAIKSFDQTFSKVWPPAGPPEATGQSKCDAARIIEQIKETGSLIAGYKQQSKTFSDLFDHLLTIINQVDGLFFGIERSIKPTDVDQTR
jgi:hypothetical protein